VTQAVLSATNTVLAHNNVQAPALIALEQLKIVSHAQVTKYWFNSTTEHTLAETNAMTENSTMPLSRPVLAAWITAPCATTLLNASNAMTVCSTWVPQQELAQSANVLENAQMDSTLMTMETANNVELVAPTAQVLIPATLAMTSLTWLTELANANSTMKSMPDQPLATLKLTSTTSSSTKMSLRM
jgi:hypothetical protein